MQSDAKWSVIAQSKVSRLSRVKTPRNAVMEGLKQGLTEKLEKF